jgi:hypothetical protein
VRTGQKRRTICLHGAGPPHSKTLGIMALTLLIGILLFPFLVFLIQEYRDARGRRRNNVGRCYKCGGLMYPPIAMLHYHYRSPSSLHFYCAVCANAEDRKGRIWLSVAGIAVGVTFAAVALRESVSSFWGAALFGAASVLIVVLIPLVLLKPGKSRAQRSVEAGNLPVWKTDAALIAETKRLLAIENDPKTKAELQHVLDLATILDSQASAARSRPQR